MNKFMDRAYIEAKKAYSNGDVPVGAIIVENNKIISVGYNKKEKENDPTQHAEIIAIKKACKKKKSWHLDDCELYVTLEPCLMCCGAILQSRIKKVIYSIPNSKFGYVESVNNLLNNKNNHKVEIYKSEYDVRIYEIMKKFFIEKRK